MPVHGFVEEMNVCSHPDPPAQPVVVHAQKGGALFQTTCLGIVLDVTHGDVRLILRACVELRDYVLVFVCM